MTELFDAGFSLARDDHFPGQRAHAPVRGGAKQATAALRTTGGTTADGPHAHDGSKFKSYIKL